MSGNNIYYRYFYSLKDSEIESKYKFIGEGISRRVFDLNNGMVLKLAKGEDGHYQNKVENYIYNHAGVSHKKYLCPVLWFTPRMVIMKKAEAIIGPINENTIDLSIIRPELNAEHEINTLAKRFFLLYEDVVAVSSWGSINGKNVMIDYGCTNELGDLFYDLMFLFNPQLYNNKRIFPF